MGFGKCLKCGVYGSVERHHPLPQRWFRSEWTEALCKDCHKQADQITFDVDHDYRIKGFCAARHLQAVYTRKFIVWMNIGE